MKDVWRESGLSLHVGCNDPAQVSGLGRQVLSSAEPSPHQPQLKKKKDRKSTLKYIYQHQYVLNINLYKNLMTYPDITLTLDNFI